MEKGFVFFSVSGWTEGQAYLEVLKQGGPSQVAPSRNLGDAQKVYQQVWQELNTLPILDELFLIVLILIAQIIHVYWRKWEDTEAENKN